MLPGVAMTQWGQIRAYVAVFENVAEGTANMK